MTSTSTRRGHSGKFTRQEWVDTPAILGARWWHEGIQAQVPRRQALTALLALSGAVVGVGSVAVGAVNACRGTSNNVTFEPRGALAMQHEFGWDFGARGEALVFDGTTTQPFDRSALERLPAELAPTDPRLKPYYVSTLFQSPWALPTSAPSGEPDDVPFRRLSEAMTPISTSAMTRAYAQGEAFINLLDADPRARYSAVVVDLQGPESVAFAAGASNKLDPVFLFDNWPHPRGVVPSHLTLAAAAYFQPLFASTRSVRPRRTPPIFVLDRRRLAAYADDASQFDNRHTARLPSTANLKELGITTLFYISPNAIDRLELDDLVDDFLAFQKASMGVFVLPATSIEGSSLDKLEPYVSSPRVTPYSSGTASSSSAVRTRPTGFGVVPVAVAVGTGVVLGAKMSRSGSWNRTNYGSSSS
jgi:hypothetical protein